jgi:hypothetical protein
MRRRLDHRRPWRRRRAGVGLVLLAVIAGGASAADARPAQTPPGLSCEEMEQQGFPQDDVDACRQGERERQCRQLDLSPEDLAECMNPSRPDPCLQYSSHPEVMDLCDAFADFGFLFPDAAIERHCVDPDTLEIAGRCEVPEWQFRTIADAFWFDDDYACNNQNLGFPHNNDSRAYAWYRLAGWSEVRTGFSTDPRDIFEPEAASDPTLNIDFYGTEGLNVGFAGAYQRICVDGPRREAWRPAHVAVVGVIMAVERHRAPAHDGKDEGLCHSWDPNNRPNVTWAQGAGGLIRVPLNTICNTLYYLGFPAYPARSEIAVHPGCEVVDAIDPRGSEGRGNDPGAPVLADFLPDGCWGRYPATNYDIGYRSPEAADLNVAGWMWGNSTAFAFALAKGTTTLALWLVDWAFIGFDIREYDDAIAGNAAQRFADNLIHHPELPFVPLAWLILLSWAGYTVLRGRMTIAGSEILISIVLLGLSTILMARQSDYMDATWGVMDQASTALLAAGQGADPAAFEAPEGADPEVARQYRRRLVNLLNRGIFDAFVEQPYDILNWGEPLRGDDMETCASRRNWIVARGPWGTDEGARDAMHEAGGACEQLASFNAEPSGERLVGAVLVLVASIVLGAFLALVALTVVVAKFLAVLTFALTPFAALAAILPGNGRRLAWGWFTSLIQVVIVVVGSSFLLSFLLLATDGLLGSTEDAHLIERFFLLNIVVFIMWFARRRLLASSQSFAGRLADYWATTRGTGAVWTGAGPGAGIDLLAVDRGAAITAAGVAVPVTLAGMSVANRWRERRLSRRQYDNLQRVTRWKYREYRAI